MITPRGRGTRAPTIALVAIGTLLILIVVNLFTLQGLAASRHVSAHSREMLTTLDRLLMSLTDAETSERGYVLTGRLEYLAPLSTAETLVPSILSEATRLAAGDRAQSNRVAEVARLGTRKMALVREAVDLQMRGETAAAENLVRTGEGRSLMEAARQTIAAMRVEETRRLEERTAETQRYLAVAIAIDVAGAVVLLLVGFLLRGIGRDIGRRETLEGALREAVEFQQQFIAILGHDLRNPLSAISMASELLQRRERLSEHQALTVSRIASSAERMTRMVNQLMDLTRTRLGGGIPLTLVEETDLATIVAATVDELKTAHPGCEIRQQIVAAPSGTWDPDRIAELASNLIGNAVQHGRSPIDVKVSAEGRRARLEVHNGGEPIPPDLLPLLFEPLRPGRGHRPARRRGAGLGLGLFICKAIVDAHGGTIEIESSLAGGTTVRVILPASDGPPRAGSGDSPR